MGLAEPRKRLKLSKDPNNTTWTKNVAGFGHKIMKSQGWQPGDYLGAKDAPHAEFHTEANASHIRVVLKDDNLGIGAKKGSGLEQGECVGLDVFQNLLGRLNGRDEDELEREQKSREDLKRAYTRKGNGDLSDSLVGGFSLEIRYKTLLMGRQNAYDNWLWTLRATQRTQRIQVPYLSPKRIRSELSQNRRNRRSRKEPLTLRSLNRLWVGLEMGKPIEEEKKIGGG